MTGSTPPWKRRSPRQGAEQGPSDGPHHARDDERGSSGASLEPVAARTDLPAPTDSTRTPAPVARRRVAGIRDRAREGARKGGSRARAGLAYLTDRIIENAPRIP